MNVILKSVDKKDWDFILDLRNESRKYFLQNEIITKKTHYNYMEKNLNNPRFKIWIIYSEKQKLGYVRLLDTDLSTVLIEKYRGKGLGSIALKMGIEKCKELGIDKLTAMIRDDNPASFNLYSKLGFIQTKIEQNKKFLEISL